MDTEMTKVHLLEQVQVGRQQFREVIGGLDAVQMVQPDVQGAWSVKDIVAHVMAWEERTTRWLGEAASGETPVTPAPGMTWADMDRLNELTYQERKDWPLARVLDEFERLEAPLLGAVRQMSEADLLSRERFAWMGGSPLWELVAGTTFWHYDEHIPPIQNWLGSQSADPLVYYACAGPMTDPRQYRQMFDGLPTEIGRLVEVLQGLQVHIFWAERYGLTLSDERKQEVQTHSVVPKLARIRKLDSRPLIEARTLEKKLVGNCRDFAVLLTAMLRHQGVPARARCGFGAYFLPGHYEDHWVCEYWNAEQDRWVLADPQLDALQREALHISFDPLDVPRDQFVVAGQAWQMCRSGQADPDSFGIFQWHGLGFVRGNLIRDLLAQNKVEILPWDGGFGFLAEGADMELELMDHLAVLTQAGNDAFAQVRALYQQDSRFAVPKEWHRS